MSEEGRTTTEAAEQHAESHMEMDENTVPAEVAPSAAVQFSLGAADEEEAGGEEVHADFDDDEEMEADEEDHLDFYDENNENVVPIDPAVAEQRRLRQRRPKGILTEAVGFDIEDYDWDKNDEKDNNNTNNSAGSSASSSLAPLEPSQIASTSSYSYAPLQLPRLADDLSTAQQQQKSPRAHSSLQSI